MQLNLPFREPLVPGGPLGPETDRPERPFTEVLDGARTLHDGQLDRLASRIRSVERGLIVAGPSDDSTRLSLVLDRLSAAVGYPIVADALAGMTSERSVRGDHLLRPGPWLEDHRPDLVIRVGAIPTSRWTNELVAAPGHELWVLDGEAGWRQPAARPSLVIHADPALTLLSLEQRLPTLARGRSGAWGAAWTQAHAHVAEALAAWLATLDEPFEGQVFHVLSGLDVTGAMLWVGSSMPVRDLDAWWSRADRMPVESNRGANGIDGVTSSAAGAATVHEGPVVLVTGDVSFVHDLGALVTARLLGVALTIVVIDNDGGGIFSFLAQATTDRPEVGLPQRFEQLYGTPHGTRIAEVASALGAAVLEVDHRTLGPALGEAIADRSPGVRLLRYATERRRNVELHAQAARVAADVLARLAGGGA